eukprot:Gb_00737 [translate_table: standard]
MASKCVENEPLDLIPRGAFGIFMLSLFLVLERRGNGKRSAHQKFKLKRIKDQITIVLKKAESHEYVRKGKPALPDFWSFLEEIDAPQWLDLALEANSSREEQDDSWFHMNLVNLVSKSRGKPSKGQAWHRNKKPSNDTATKSSTVMSTISGNELKNPLDAQIDPSTVPEPHNSSNLLEPHNSITILYSHNPSIVPDFKIIMPRASGLLSVLKLSCLRRSDGAIPTLRVEVKDEQQLKERKSSSSKLNTRSSVVTTRKEHENDKQGGLIDIKSNFQLMDKKTTGGCSCVLFHIPSTPRPQYTFTISVHNSNVTFKHPGLQKTEDGSKFIHPVQEELTKLEFANKQSKAPEPLDPSPLESMLFKFIERVQDLKDMASKLQSTSEIVVDLEHKQYRSFQGLTCLMQISRRSEDFVVDTLILCNHIAPYLGRIFADPTIKKEKLLQISRIKIEEQNFYEGLDKGELKAANVDNISTRTIDNLPTSHICMSLSRSSEQYGCLLLNGNVALKLKWMMRWTAQQIVVIFKTNPVFSVATYETVGCRGCLPKQIGRWHIHHRDVPDFSEGGYQGWSPRHSGGR